jgi:hypothetical protein
MKNSNKQNAQIAIELENAHNGTFGRVSEIIAKNSRSKHFKVSEQNEDDCFVKCLINGSISYESAEVKTNGGRIEKCLNELLNGNDTLFIYRMKICNKNTQYIERNVDFRIGWFSDFYDILVACNAIKNTNGRNPELAIQPTSKKLFIALDSYGVPFDNENTYILNGKEITIA